MGRPFEHTGEPGWPYLSMDCLNFRHKEDVQDLRDAYCLLSEITSLDSLLDKNCLAGDRNEKVRSNLEWRAEHFDTKLKYWDLVASDVPWQLSDYFPLRSSVPLARIKPNKKSNDLGILSEHPKFRDAQLVVNELRCFHREDGKDTTNL
jgi:hypothetical protein